MRSERGFTLVEVLIVLTIVGILLGVAIPRYGSVTGAMKVRSAKQEIASLLSRGRAMAIQTEQTVQVVRTANVISLIAVRESGSTIVAQQDLAFQFGVTVSATKDTVAYDSRGMVTGNNVTLKYVVTNGVARDSVCLLALGKVSSRGCAL